MKVHYILLSSSKIIPLPLLISLIFTPINTDFCLKAFNTSNFHQHLTGRQAHRLDRDVAPTRYGPGPLEFILRSRPHTHTLVKGQVLKAVCSWIEFCREPHTERSEKDFLSWMWRKRVYQLKGQKAWQRHWTVWGGNLHRQGGQAAASKAAGPHSWGAWLRAWPWASRAVSQTWAFGSLGDSASVESGICLHKPRRLLWYGNYCVSDGDTGGLKQRPAWVPLSCSDRVEMRRLSALASSSHLVVFDVTCHQLRSYILLFFNTSLFSLNRL